MTERIQDVGAATAPVRLKVSHTGDLPPLSGVSTDGRQYGMAKELGADPVRVSDWDLPLGF
jgi:hypothetical protein